MAKSIAGRWMRRQVAFRSLVLLVWLTGASGVPAGAVAAPTTIKTVAGGGSLTGENVPALETSLAVPNGVAAASNGFFVVDQSRHRIRRVSMGPPLADTGPITTFAGTGNFGTGSAVLGGSPTAYSLHVPCCVSPTAAGNLLVADTFGGMVHRVAGSRIDTVAGTGTPSSCAATPPTGVAAVSAELCFVVGVGAHPAEPRFLIAEAGLPDQDRAGGARVYEVDANGVLKIVAGGGCPVPPANPTPLQICLGNPRGPVYTGNPLNPTEFLVADRARHVVWQISSTSATGTAARVAGTGVATAADLSDLGDDGPAGAATLSGPSDLAMAPGATFLIADRNNCRVRRVHGLSAAAPIVTVAGTRCSSDAGPGDGGPATAANLSQPQGVAFTPAGILVADSGRGTIRLVDRTSITAGPPAISTSRSAVFEFESTEPDADFHCATDAQETPTPCASPFALTDLTDGSHSFRVADAALPGDPSPALRQWVVDTTAPDEFRLAAPADGAVEQPPRPVFEWEPARDATTGVARYEIWVDGEHLQSVAADGCRARTCRAEAVVPLREDRHQWHVRAVDGAGLVRHSSTWTMDVGSAPTAQLVVSPNPALVDSTVVVDASGSSDANGPLVRFEWDLDGDGSFERDTGAQGLTTMSYPVPGFVTISVRVTDAVGRTAVATRTLRVSEPPDAPGSYGVSIEDGQPFTNDRRATLHVAFPAGTTSVLVSNDGGFLAAAQLAPERLISWRLPSTGPERLPKTVYVRFRSGPFVSETYTDDIILDELAPELTSARLATPNRPPRATRVARMASHPRRRWVLSVRARDSISGLARMQITSDRRRRRVPTRRFGRRVTVVSKAERLWVRVLDRAGNASRWRVARYSGPR